MKNTLIYQSCEFDCGPTTLVNAIRFLYEREEIDPALIKAIWTMGNDTFNHQGAVGKHGTSKAAMRYMADWFTDYGRGWNFPIRAFYLDGDDSRILPDSQVMKCLKNGGCAVIRCWSGQTGHYVLLTKLLEDDCIGLWDPYDEEPEFEDLTVRRCVWDQPKVMNRIVKRDAFNMTDRSDYAMGAPEMREALLIWRENPEPHEEIKLPFCGR